MIMHIPLKLLAVSNVVSLNVEKVWHTLRKNKTLNTKINGNMIKILKIRFAMDTIRCSIKSIYNN